MFINTIAKFISKKIVKSKLLKSNESRVFNATELTFDEMVALLAWSKKGEPNTLFLLFFAWESYAFMKGVNCKWLTSLLHSLLLLVGTLVEISIKELILFWTVSSMKSLTGTARSKTKKETNSNWRLRDSKWSLLFFAIFSYSFMRNILNKV